VERAFLDESINDQTVRDGLTGSDQDNSLFVIRNCGKGYDKDGRVMIKRE
jgi:hypothetical protein